MEERGVTIDSIVTDRRPQIQKFLREADITHYYDVWHMEKGIILCLIFPREEKKVLFMITVLPLLFVHTVTLT